MTMKSARDRIIDQKLLSAKHLLSKKTIEQMSPTPKVDDMPEVWAKSSAPANMNGFSLRCKYGDPEQMLRWRQEVALCLLNVILMAQPLYTVDGRKIDHIEFKHKETNDDKEPEEAKKHSPVEHEDPDRV